MSVISTGYNPIMPGQGQSCPVRLDPPNAPSAPAPPSGPTDRANISAQEGMTAVKVDGWGKGKNDCLEHVLLNQGYSMQEIYAKGADGKSMLQNVASNNGMKDPNLLRPGQTLQITPKEVKPAPAGQVKPQTQGPVDAHPDLHGPESELGQAVDHTGAAISDAGKSIAGAGHWLQEKVGQGAKWMTDRVDSQAAEDKKGWLGQTAIGRGLIDAEQTVGHFGGGLVKGIASLGTGLVSAAGGVVQLAGGATQYAVNDKYRAEVNDSVGKFAEDPGAVARNLGTELKGAWDKDHADFLGQAVGVVGGTVATLGLGAARGAGAVAEGTEVVVAGRAGARGAEFAQEAGRAGTRGAEFAQGAARTEPAAEAASAARAFTIPKSSNDALQILGLKPGATAQEIKAAYRRMAQEYHPDRFPGGSDVATQNMQAINVARDLLK